MKNEELSEENPLRDFRTHSASHPQIKNSPLGEFLIHSSFFIPIVNC